MNPVETALVLDRLGIAYRQEIPAEALEVWSSHLAEVPADVCMDAVENVIGLEAFFPTIARFKQEIGAVHRQRAVESQQAATRGESGPSRDCPTCSGMKWFPGPEQVKTNPDTGEVEARYETWKPCQRCAPIEFHRWLEWRAERDAQDRFSRPGTSEDDQLRRALDEARRQLEGVGS